MSVEVKFVEPTLELINEMAEDMRDQDVEEVWYSNHYTPRQALVTGLENSTYTAIAVVDDKPCVIFGLVKRDLLSGSALVWLLGTNNALNYRRQFMVQGRKVLDEMLKMFPILYNYVYSGNSVSIRWLKALGFTIGKGEPFGPDRKIFHKFHIERTV